MVCYSRITVTGHPVERVESRWSHLSGQRGHKTPVRDSYGVAIDPGQKDVLILAVTVCIDMMAHEGR